MRRKIGEDVNGNPTYYAVLKDMDTIIDEFGVNHNGLFMECNATFLRVTTMKAIAGATVKLTLFGAGYLYGAVEPKDDSREFNVIEVDLRMIERFLDDEIDAEYFI